MALGVSNRADLRKFQDSPHHNLPISLKRSPVWAVVGFIVLLGTIPFSTYMTLQGVWEAQGRQWGPTLLALAMDTAKVSFVALAALYWTTRRHSRALVFASLWIGVFGFSLLNSYATFLRNQVVVEREAVTDSETYRAIEADLAEVTEDLARNSHAIESTQAAIAYLQSINHITKSRQHYPDLQRLKDERKQLQHRRRELRSSLEAVGDADNVSYAAMAGIGGLVAQSLGISFTAYCRALSVFLSVFCEALSMVGFSVLMEALSNGTPKLQLLSRSPFSLRSRGLYLRFKSSKPKNKSRSANYAHPADPSNDHTGCNAGGRREQHRSFLTTPAVVPTTTGVVADGVVDSRAVVADSNDKSPTERRVVREEVNFLPHAGPGRRRDGGLVRAPTADEVEVARGHRAFSHAVAIMQQNPDIGVRPLVFAIRSRTGKGIGDKVCQTFVRMRDHGLLPELRQLAN